MIEFLLDEKNVGLAGSLVAAITPLAALVLFLILLPRSQKWVRSGLFWVAGFSGPLLVTLWYLYNGIEDRFGLDSVFALCLNLLIFCIVGLSLGMVVRLTMKKHAGADTNAESGGERR